MKYTTLNEIESRNPCNYGWAMLLKYLNKSSADDEIIYFDQILEGNGLDDAIWALRALKKDDSYEFLADMLDLIFPFIENSFDEKFVTRSKKEIGRIRTGKRSNLEKKRCAIKYLKEFEKKVGTDSEYVPLFYARLIFLKKPYWFLSFYAYSNLRRFSELAIDINELEQKIEKLFRKHFC